MNNSIEILISRAKLENLFAWRQATILRMNDKQEGEWQYYKPRSFDANSLKTTPACAIVFCSDGVSPSGKATGSGPVMRGFESLHPSQKEFSALFATMRQLAPKVRLAHCR